MALELSAGELLHHFRDYLRHCGALMATAVLVLLSCALKGEGPEEVVTFARPEIVAAVYNTFNGGVATVPEGLSFSSTKVSLHSYGYAIELYRQSNRSKMETPGCIGRADGSTNACDSFL